MPLKHADTNTTSPIPVQAASTDLRQEGKRTRHTWGALLLLESPGPPLLPVTGRHPTLPGYSTVDIPIFEDNAGAITFVENPLTAARSRHIDVQHHFITTLRRNGMIKMVYVPKEEQHANVLTKNFGLESFVRRRNALMNIATRWRKGTICISRTWTEFE